jgi:DNA repair protein RecN (Recombination protein N)
MLTNLRIKNFAIIDYCELEFTNGFTVFTGETGAGKSIIIDAISMLLGKQANEDMIKTGNDTAIIEGTFDITQIINIPELEEYIDEDKKLLVVRKISKNKGNLIRINDQSVTLKTLKRIIPALINIMGQNSQLELFNNERQLEILDMYSTSNDIASQLHSIKENLKGTLNQYKQIESKLEKIRSGNNENERKKEFLQFQISDILEPQFIKDEDLNLEQQRKEIKNLSKLKNLFSELENNMSKIAEISHTSARDIKKIIEIDASYNNISDYLDTVSIESDDMLKELNSKASHIGELKEQDIDQIENRLDLIFRYKTKYKVQTVNQILELAENFQKELILLDENESDSKALESSYYELKEKNELLAKKLNKIRTKNAIQMSALVESKMKHLNFQNCKFSIEVESCPESISFAGSDKISFLVSTNPGEPLKQLQKIASGGELSRILLAINSALNKKQLYTTMIFDEVDTGVGGLTAIKIGEYLKAIANGCQVFCITHLPQIAKFAQNHFLVEKSSELNKTKVTAKQLEAIETPLEIKRMIGGDHVLNLIEQK